MVFELHRDRLHLCCPIFFHGDEGTSYSKKGLFQYSWSPMLSAGASGLHRYFLVSQISRKFYASLAKGNLRGNPALDAIMAAGVRSCLTAFQDGIPMGEDTLYLVTLGLSGDHVFHASHVCSSFSIVSYPTH